MPKTNENSRTASNLSAGSVFEENEIVHVCAHTCVGVSAHACV